MPVIFNGNMSNAGTIPSGLKTTVATPSVAPELTRDQYNAMAMRVHNRVNEADVGVSPWEKVGRWAAGTAIDLADTVWSSPLIPNGAERGDVWATASAEEKDYYERHKGLIEGSSAVAGGIMTAVMAEALVIPKLTSALASSTAIGGSSLWRAASGWNAATRVNMIAAQRAAAEAGEAFGLLGSSAGRQFLTNRVTAGVATVTRTLPVEYGVMWNNESFNSGEWSKEGFWIAAGAVLGGGIGAASARGAARKIANSAEIRDLRAAPFAMAGMTNDLLSPEHLDRIAKIDVNQVQLKESARFTELMMGSRAANPAGYDEMAENATRISKLRDEYGSFAVDSLQSIIAKGIAGVDTMKIPVATLPEAKHLVTTVAKTDPFVLHGLASGGLMKGTLKEAREGRLAHIESLKLQSDVAAKKGNIKEAKRLNIEQRVLKQQEEHVLVNGAWVNPDSELAKAVVEHKPESAIRAIFGVNTTDGVKVALPVRGKVTLDASLTPFDGRGILAVETLGHKDRLYLAEAANQLVKKLATKGAKTKFKLTDKSGESWFSLDLAAEIIDRGGSIEFATKKLGLMNVDDMRRSSLRMKARAALAEVGDSGRITPEIRFKYNLPAPTALERIEDSAGDGFRAWLNGAAKDEGTARELATALSETRAIQGIELLPAGDTPLIRTDGDMLRFNRDKDGVWMRPMLGYFDQKSHIETITARGHANAMTLRKAEKTAVLVNGRTHTSQLANQYIRSPELPIAMNVAGLHNDQSTGLGSGLGQLVGEILPKRFRHRDNPVILAATKLQEAAERHGLATFKSMMDSVGMQKAVTQVTSAGHAPTRTMLDQYFSLSAGWDIVDEAPLGDGLIGFLLKDTEGNRKRLGMAASDEWDDYTFMPNTRLDKPIAVNAEAMSAIKSYNALTDSLLEADNHLRRAKGLTPVERRNFYTPPPNTRGAHVAFVFDPANKLMVGRTIVARSQEEYNKLVKRTLDELGPNSGYTIRDREQLTTLRDVWDESGMDWIDPGTSSALAGLGSQSGGLTGAYVRQGAFNEALEWVKRKTVAQSQDTLKQIMDESLLVARVHGVTEASVGAQKGKRNIYDEYEQALTGNSKSYAESSIGDKAFKRVEESINRVFANSGVITPARHVIDLAQRLGMDPTDLSGKKTFKAIADSMGRYTPFANATEFVESRGISRPPTVKGMAQSMNSIAASVLLRWFELPHAMMNGLGLIATMPATVMEGRAPISTFASVQGKNVGIIDGAKIISSGMADMFTKRRKADWEYMVASGDAGQSVMEYHQALGSIQSQAGFNKVMQTADKWASIASDSSENWSRQIAHFVGLRMADNHGIEGMAARHDFAREIANSFIADYAPINRPELFNSGFGSMFGLFQSYALNHYTKMFRWMENGQYKQVGVQAAMQATMFGLPGTYGLGHLMDMRDSTIATGSDPTALDLIYEHFGPVLGGAIAHGSISEVTQLAMWTRGDTNFRIPGASGTLAPLDVGTKVARGFIDGVSAYLNAMPGEGTNAMLEVVQREMPNRVLKSWITLANGGKEIDAYGQVMNETQTWMDTVARVVGVRSGRQQSELEAFYAGKGAMERDANQMEKLRESFRSAVRNHGGDVSKVSPMQYFNDYVKAGGNPRLFKTWAKNLLRDSNSPRSLKSLNKSMVTPRSALETWRFGAYGAWAVQ